MPSSNKDGNILAIKQGGPCSSYYFLVLAEVLALELRNDVNVQGIFLNDLKKFLGQFADDMDLYLQGNSDNVKNALEIIKNFEKQSGFKTGYEKNHLVSH